MATSESEFLKTTLPVAVCHAVERHVLVRVAVCSPVDRDVLVWSSMEPDTHM